MAEAAAAVAVGGSLVKAYGDIQESEAQAEQLENEAIFKQEQAEEIMRRAKLNAFMTVREGKQLKAEQTGALAASGVATGEGTSLTILEETTDIIAQQIKLDLMEANYETIMLQNSAARDRESAKDVRKAGRIKAVRTCCK